MYTVFAAFGIFISFLVIQIKSEEHMTTMYLKLYMYLDSIIAGYSVAFKQRMLHFLKSSCSQQRTTFLVKQQYFQLTAFLRRSCSELQTFCVIIQPVYHSLWYQIMVCMSPSLIILRCCPLYQSVCIVYTNHYLSFMG